VHVLNAIKRKVTEKQKIKLIQITTLTHGGKRKKKHIKPKYQIVDV